MDGLGVPPVTSAGGIGEEIIGEEILGEEKSPRSPD